MSLVLLLLLLPSCVLFDTSGTDARILALTDEDGDGASLAGGDCDDLNPTVFPGAPELCDEVDNNCDRQVDEDGIGFDWCLDEDGDGHGDAETTQSGCYTPTTAVRTCDDCDDRDFTVLPGAVEQCNGKDDDCDGVTDPATSLGALTFYQDQDEDGYGDENRTTVACDQPAGFASTADDCDDTTAAANPAAVEVCDDGLDNDCDGTANGCGLYGEHLVEPRAGEAGYFDPPDGRSSEGFGEAVHSMDTNEDGLAEPVVISNGYYYDNRGGGGAISFFRSPPAGQGYWDETDAVAYGPEDARLAETAAPFLWDSDGDGVQELVAGAPGDGVGLPSAGSVFLLPALPTAPTELTASDILISGIGDEQLFGFAVVPADSMYDGDPTLAIGAPYNSDAAYYAGKLYFWSPTDGDLSQARGDIHGTLGGLYVGTLASSVADMDGDGVGDILLSPEECDLTPCDVSLFRGPILGSVGLDEADATFLDPEETDLGLSIAAPADLLGDGLTTAVIGSAGDQGAETYLISGSVTGKLRPADVAAMRLDVPNGWGRLSFAAGDVNGDHSTDLLIGTPDLDEDTRGIGSGGVFLAYGPLAYTGVVDLPAVAGGAWLGEGDHAYAGRSVALGDTNNDGFDDLLFTGRNPDLVDESESSVWYYRGEGL